ncbi:Aspartic proteinase [Nymphaea thermarum]|nr:Aspartic proteinase [Nymphaea thermarum]
MAAFFTSFITLLGLLQIFTTTNSARVGIVAPKRHGFSLDLVHRDSPASPLYDPTFTLTDRAVEAARRSIWRSRHFASRFSGGVSTKIYSPMKSGSGEFLMKLALGTPARLHWAIADTGSDLIWTQCLPCESCSGPKMTMFDPHKSSTYKTQSCSTSFCDDLPTEGKYCNKDRLCGFHYVYGDQSYADGVLSKETLTFDTGVHGTIKFPSTTLGCVHDESGNVATAEVSGLVGLGGGPLSLISQISSAIDNKFAYCLISYYDTNSTGQLKFGAGAEFSGTGTVQQTEMAQGSAQGTFYVLTLDDVSVGGKKLNVKFDGARPTALGDAKSIIIDSGTTLTLLSQEAYDPVESAVASAVKFEKVEPVEGFSLCYHVKSSDLQGFPSVTFHFAGADWELPPENAFLLVAEEVVCLAIVPSNVGIAIFGNVAQQNFHVEYDLGKGVLSFVPTDCSRV